MLTPFLFRPVYKDYLWGGQRIAQKYARETPFCCAESWEISDHEHGMSVVESDDGKGKTLHELLEAHGEALLGQGRSAARFPLLVKLIDARDRLSVQVHPNEKTALLTQGDPKTEMWYALDGSPEMAVYAGLADGVTPEIFAEHLQKGEMNAVLHRYVLRPGDVVFIPGGLVHAIDRGSFLLEVQQNSDTTYRLWDWGRVDASGLPRELHVRQAMKSIDWADRRTPLIAPLSGRRLGENSETVLIANDYFIMKSFEIADPLALNTEQRCFEILFLARGDANISCGNHSIVVEQGRTVLIPASVGAYTVEPVSGEPGEVIFITMPFPQAG